MALSRLSVFVYGTLKRQQPNHFWLTDINNGYSNYLGVGKTLIQYPLIIATKYNIPFLLPEPGTGHIVTGEVYEVDDKMLSRLDVLEEHPNYYERRLEPIETEFDSKPLLCWVYFLKDHREDLLSFPMLTSYDTYGDHGLKYSEKADRDPNYDYITPVKQTKETMLNDFLISNEQVEDDD